MGMAMTSSSIISPAHPAAAGRTGFAIARASLLSLRLLLP
jgi:hypothetical protein